MLPRQAVRRAAPAGPGARGRRSSSKKHATPLVRLAHHRWSVPTLADLSTRGGGRISELAHRLGGSRGAVRQAAEALASMGLLESLGGHGHPLRPEIVLTEDGRRAARAARRLETAVSNAVATDLVRRKWTLPVLHALGLRARRYGEVRKALPSVTDRALSAALRDLEAAGLLSREVVEDAPPFTRYRTTAAARGLVQLARGLAAELERRRGAANRR